MNKFGSTPKQNINKLISNRNLDMIISGNKFSLLRLHTSLNDQKWSLKL